MKTYMIRIRILVIAGISAALAVGQPIVPPRAIVNASSSIPPSLPGGAIAQGSVFAITGAGLGPKSPVQAAGLPLQISLAGVSVKVQQPSTGVDAYPLYASDGLLYVLMPSSAPLGRDSVIVTFNSARSNPAPVTVVGTSFGIWSAAAINPSDPSGMAVLNPGGSGTGPGYIQNLNSDGSLTQNTLNTPATPGQTVSLLGTGLGPIKAPDNAPPPPDNLPTKVEVFVGGESAQLVSSGRAPFPGVDQITFILPADVVTGCYVPIQVRTGGATVSNSASISITADGSDCTLVQPQFLPPGGGNAGVAVLTRTAVHAEVEVAAPVDSSLDTALVYFRKSSSSVLPFQSLFTLPAGTCSTMSVPMDVFDEDQAGGLFPGGPYLNAGATGSVAGPNSSATLFPDPTGSNLLGSLMGMDLQSLAIHKSFLDPGNYVVNVAGGPDVGPVQAKVTVEDAVVWTNRDQVGIIDRSQPLVLNWSNDDPTENTLILAANADVPTNSTGLFACVAGPGVTTFAVPSQILSALPASRFRYLEQRGLLFLAPVSAGGFPSFTASGLDAGVILPLVLTGKMVMFQ